MKLKRKLKQNRNEVKIKEQNIKKKLLNLKINFKKRENKLI